MKNHKEKYQNMSCDYKVSTKWFKPNPVAYALGIFTYYKTNNTLVWLIVINYNQCEMNP